MRHFLVKEIRRIVDGRLVKGSDDLLITEATNRLGYMTRPNMLLFLKNKQNIDWNILRDASPCAVITDRIFGGFNTIDHCSVILVRDIDAAFWMFVDYYRSLSQIPVISVTGTSGKTTTKDMIMHILKADFNVHGTVDSFNHYVFAFHYLLGIDESTDVAVFETSVSGPGDIAYACKFFKPTMGIITNIGVAHLDGCSTPEAYIAAKAEMLSALAYDGVLIINADDKNTRKIHVERYEGRKVRFGIENPSEFRGSEIQYVNNGMKFTLIYRGLKYNVFVPGYGKHQVYNALAAIAATHELGVHIKDAVMRLKTFKNLPRHLELVNGIKGSLILDDTWNMTPSALTAAFETLNDISEGKKKVALIGELLRLGEYSDQIINQVTDMMIEQAVDVLILTGATAGRISRQLIRKGTRSQVYSFPRPEDALQKVIKILDKDTVLLVKCHMHDDAFQRVFRNLH